MSHGMTHGFGRAHLRLVWVVFGATLTMWLWCVLRLPTGVRSSTLMLLFSIARRHQYALKRAEATNGTATSSPP